MILQFGTSRFLQAHVALFAHEAREAGQDVPPITVVKTTRGNARDMRLSGFANPAGYDVILRGLHHGERVETCTRVRAIVGGLSAERDWGSIMAIALGDLAHIVSNTGDSGYDIPAQDRVRGAPHHPPLSFPAMLLALLHARWQAGLGGVIVLPCELVRQNGRVLHTIVADLANDLGSGPDFLAWMEDECRWVNTLVDRIVSGALDPVGAIAEPYALWAVEDQPGLTMPFAHPDVILTGDLEPYERLKLHILNLGHTWLAERWHRAGAPDDLVVRVAMKNHDTRAALETLFATEVLSGFACHGMETQARTYIASTLERFANPFLDHRIADIHAGHAAKVSKRIAVFIDWVDAVGNHAPPMPELRALAAGYMGHENRD